eukprot:scaffold1808_cov360-Prasinococcus_capsulatus_cf.AAC.20
MAAIVAPRHRRLLILLLHALAAAAVSATLCRLRFSLLLRCVAYIARLLAGAAAAAAALPPFVHSPPVRALAHKELVQVGERRVDGAAEVERLAVEPARTPFPLRPRCSCASASP